MLNFVRSILLAASSFLSRLSLFQSSILSGLLTMSASLSEFLKLVAHGDTPCLVHGRHIGALSKESLYNGQLSAAVIIGDVVVNLEVGLLGIHYYTFIAQEVFQEIDRTAVS